MRVSGKHFLRDIDALVSDLGVDRTIREQLAELVAQQVLRERERCVRICRDRAETWRKTTGAQSTITAAREEARNRANEAAYLADLLESGQDLSAMVN